MTFFYLTFSTMFVILLIGAILEDRRSTPVEQTVKAILARFNGDAAKAVQYCNQIADHASNPALRLEYNTLGQRIWNDAVRKEKAEAAHV